MQMSNDWYAFLSALHSLTNSQKLLGRAPRYDLIGRALSSFLNDPAGITDYTAWRVIGITPTALSTIESNNFQVSGLLGRDKIVRGHIVQRKKLCEHLFDNNQFVSKAYFEQHFENNDVTVLMCKYENSPKLRVPDFYPIQPNFFPFNYQRAALFATTFANYTYAAAEVAVLRRLSQLVANSSIQKVSPSTLTFIDQSLV